MTHAAKDRLLLAGLAMLLERGYGDMGIQALLDATGVPKGSFYHHLRGKEDFALQVIDRYTNEVHAGLDERLRDGSRPPAGKARRFARGSAVILFPWARCSTSISAPRPRRDLFALRVDRPVCLGSLANPLANVLTEKDSQPEESRYV